MCLHLLRVCVHMCLQTHVIDTCTLRLHMDYTYHSISYMCLYTRVCIYYVRVYGTRVCVWHTYYTHHSISYIVSIPCVIVR